MERFQTPTPASRWRTAVAAGWQFAAIRLVTPSLRHGFFQSRVISVADGEVLPVRVDVGKPSSAAADLGGEDGPAAGGEVTPCGAGVSAQTVAARSNASKARIRQRMSGSFKTPWSVCFVEDREWFVRAILLRSWGVSRCRFPRVLGRGSAPSRPTGLLVLEQPMCPIDSCQVAVEGIGRYEPLRRTAKSIESFRTRQTATCTRCPLQ